MPDRRMTYAARTSYQERSVAVEYETARFTGALGRYRYKREQVALAELVARLPQRITVLDCPSGTGRWWPLLATRASAIVAVDLSLGMIEFAQARRARVRVPVRTLLGDAEAIPLRDRSVDFTFCHALMKHLPFPIQLAVLSEFARVSRAGVICSFSVVSGLTYPLWRLRKIKESYPLLEEQLGSIADAAGLTVLARRKCTTPMGIESAVLLGRPGQNVLRDGRSA